MLFLCLPPVLPIRQCTHEHQLHTFLRFYLRANTLDGMMDYCGQAECQHQVVVRELHACVTTTDNPGLDVLLHSVLPARTLQAWACSSLTDPVRGNSLAQPVTPLHASCFLVPTVPFESTAALNGAVDRQGCLQEPKNEGNADMKVEEADS